MMILKEHYAKHICLIAFLLVKLLSFLPSSAANINCIVCGEKATSPCRSDLKETPVDCGDAAGFDKCYTKIDTNGAVIRGCTNSKDNICENNNNCLVTEPGQNNQLICSKCENCSDVSTNEIKYRQICGAGIKNCFIKVDNKLVNRGCAADTQCTDEKSCKMCEANNCNTGIFPENRLQCYQCSGSNCNDITASKLAAQPCPTYEDNEECFTKGESEETMVRGCKSDAKENPCSSPAESCDFCNKTECNDLKYKREQKLLCYQCKSVTNVTDTNCYKEQTDKSYENKKCVKEILYNQKEYCYTHIKNDTLERGCLHDNTDLSAEKCADDDKESCNKCNAGDGCNNKAIEITCIRCRSDIDVRCWNEADKLTGENCRGSGSFTDGCFQGIWHGVAIRGCVVDASPQDQATCKDPKDSQCSICKEKNCNTKRSSASKVGLSSTILFAFFVFLCFGNFK